MHLLGCHAELSTSVSIIKLQVSVVEAVQRVLPNRAAGRGSLVKEAIVLTEAVGVHRNEQAVIRQIVMLQALLCMPVLVNVLIRVPHTRLVGLPMLQAFALGGRRQHDRGQERRGRRGR